MKFAHALVSILRPTAGTELSSRHCYQQYEISLLMNVHLFHLNKMRAASTVMLAYMDVVYRNAVPRNSLVLAHTIAIEGSELARNVVRKHQKNSEEPRASLEDAWMRPLEPPDATADILDGPPEKRPKLSLAAPIVRSWILLTAAARLLPTSSLCQKSICYDNLPFPLCWCRCAPTKRKKAKTNLDSNVLPGRPWSKELG